MLALIVIFWLLLIPAVSFAAIDLPQFPQGIEDLEHIGGVLLTLWIIFLIIKIMARLFREVQIKGISAYKRY